MLAYVILAPLVFFAPLATAHGIMSRAKYQLLIQIAERFEGEYDSIHAKVSHRLRYQEDNASSGLKDDLTRLQELQDFYKLTAQFPVWPFSLQNVTRFSTSYLFPLALPLLIDLFSRWLTP